MSLRIPRFRLPIAAKAVLLIAGLGLMSALANRFCLKRIDTLEQLGSTLSEHVSPARLALTEAKARVESFGLATYKMYASANGDQAQQAADSLKGEWKAGPRNMIDLYDLVIRHYYDPAMVGSNSIKHVLPATLNSSEFLKAKYSEPIYGGSNGIHSYNFIEPKRWVVLDDGKVIDPYKSLGKLFNDESDHDYEVLTSGIDEINDGGAAMAAYGKLQYQEMPDEERAALNGGLLRYCELDTLAMVMIYEAWRAVI